MQKFCKKVIFFFNKKQRVKKIKDFPLVFPEFMGKVYILILLLLNTKLTHKIHQKSKNIFLVRISVVAEKCNCYD